MTCYAVAQISIHDRERYDKYRAGFVDLLTKYHGRLLAADDHPDVAEGQWAYDRIVILAFDDRQALHTWATSPEYSELVKDRHAATDGVVLIVHGLGE